MKKVVADLLKAVRDVYSLGLGIWDLSPETLLLQIGPEINSGSPRSPVEPDGGSGRSCFGELDSLRRNQFQIKVKDMAVKKRSQC